MATTLLKIEELIKGADVLRNLTVPELVEEAIRNGEGVLTKDGALSVSTGKFTGRSPKDKFVVQDEVSNSLVDWGPVNQPIAEDKFTALLDKVLTHLETKQKLYYLEASAGADEHYTLPVRAITEYAWHSLFAKQLFLREWPTRAAFDPFTVIYAPSYKADPTVDGTNSETFILVSFAKRTILIGGTEYGGEIKKSIFSVMNFLLPEQHVLSMHCSANVSDAGETALFFGLSGTGKTTLSADTERHLIGDDEHGWSPDGIFNIEGGCYAKTINLSRENEPQIYDAIRFGSLIENVVLNEDRSADYKNISLTENTRAAYPIQFIDNAMLPSRAGHPNTIVFLTADAYGVLPPISKLTKEQAMYHFLSGYTSKLAGTERGVTEPQATFSTCFGSPFLPLAPERYADMLGKLIEQHNVDVYLVNTGWTGGAYGEGSRMKLSYTRAMVNAAINGQLRDVDTVKHDIFNVDIPVHIDGVPQDVLNPRDTWKDTAHYDVEARALALKFQQNFKRFTKASEKVIAAGPIVF
ncbi:phosphoenolpyruvate carboxykinase (ATP) [Exiguobacterium sp. SH0S2]|uniref:phosphoenolpyruvate carboxykinase (ATP) n=1 Tax=Exiguobacterium sp. SH0S2 TaxID=2510950 RepID=UPI001040DBE5|nr:phosphoenolpyruvate carboxykinase (ATP) [Exiguobacterium sp. SH0S2]TCI61607.1 phosphoenolpyruvate carboxykinase (ATP) [Exiguobacterium sp. SH0S2]